MIPRAWAAFTREGEPIIRTVHDSERGAKVNWLYAFANVHVSNAWTDEQINIAFANLQKFGVTIREVTVAEKK